MGAELGPPLIESGKDMAKRRFASVRGGFDPKAVDEFLVAIASGIEGLESELRRRPVSTDLWTDRAEAADRRAERIARLIAVAETEIEEMLDEMRAEAATIVSEAGEEADRIRNDARGAAERSLEEVEAGRTQAEEDASQMLSAAEARRSQMTEELREMQEHLLRVAKDLELPSDVAEAD